MTNELNIKQIGQTNWPRYVLMKGADRFWTGASWNDQCGQAALYCSDSDAAHDLELLEKYAPREFTVPCTIRMDVREDWTAENVAEFLQQHVRISEGCDNSENPNDYLCHLDIEWSLIEEVE